MTSDGQPYHRARYKEIIAEQVILGYLTKGGVTYQDSEKMTPHERRIALDTIKELLDTQNRKQEEAINQSKINKQNKSPKSRLTSK